MNPLLAQGSYPPPGTPYYIGQFQQWPIGAHLHQSEGRSRARSLRQHRILPELRRGAAGEDIRGATNHYTTDGTPYTYIPNVHLLTKTRGAETGFRSKPIEGLETGLSLFWQDFDAEQQFNADSGTSVYGRPGRRLGLRMDN